MRISSLSALVSLAIFLAIPASPQAMPLGAAGQAISQPDSGTILAAAPPHSPAWYACHHYRNRAQRNSCEVHYIQTHAEQYTDEYIMHHHWLPGH